LRESRPASDCAGGITAREGWNHQPGDGLRGLCRQGASCAPRPRRAQRAAVQPVHGLDAPRGL